MRPKNRLQAGKPAASPSQSQINQRQRILVVDDDEDIRRVNTEVLSASGYKVDTAADGAIAWDTFKLNSYDLLVTDHQMPKVTGIELLKKLRAARLAVPVILISGTIPTHELSRHPWLQIDATLLKPYTADDLLATVRKVLYATDGIAEQEAAAPNRQNQPTAGRLLL